MLDQLAHDASDVPRSRALCRAALRALDMDIHSEGWAWAMFSQNGAPIFLIGAPENGAASSAPLHFVLAAPDRAAADAFHVAPPAASGRDSGAHCRRARFHSNDDAAFVIDPDGHNIEAACHAPGAAKDQT